MTEYIDHAAEAAEGIRTVPIEGNMPTDEVANWISLHQVQATLALVEQQRIANLIALASCPVPELASAGGAALLEGEKTGGYGPYVPPRVRHEIRKGLRL